MILTSTAGNTTCFTKKKYRLSNIRKEYLAEQYASYSIDLDGNINVTMYGEEFCGGAIMAACLLDERAFIEVDCLGVNVTCKKFNDSLIEGRFPLGLVEYISWLAKDTVKVKMTGITQIITKDKSLIENGRFNKLVKSEDDLCIGVTFLSGRSIIPRVYVKKLGTVTFEKACTSASIAVNETFGLRKIIQPSKEVIEIEKDNAYVVRTKCKILRSSVN